MYFILRVSPSRELRLGGTGGSPLPPPLPSEDSNSLPFFIIIFLYENCYKFPGFPVDNVDSDTTFAIVTPPY